MNSSVDFAVVTNSHLSVEIHRLKVMFSITLSVNTSSNVFSKSIGPGIHFSLGKNNLSEVDCKSQLRDSVGM
jgi:hypothetical protein